MKVHCIFCEVDYTSYLYERRILKSWRAVIAICDTWFNSAFFRGLACIGDDMYHLV